MKVSIITTSYNSGETIRDTLSSVAQQTYPNIEHIIIDGQSTDDSLDIVNEFSHVAKVISEKDKGIYDAMNKGLMNATGDVIGILNSDDILFDNHAIQKIVDAFNAQEIDAVYGNIEYVTFDLKRVTRIWNSRTFSKNLIWAAWQPPHPGFYAKKTTYQKVGSFDLSFKIAADFDWLFRAFYVKRIKSDYIDTRIVKMREGGASNGSLKIRYILIKDYFKTYKMNNRALLGVFAIPLRLLSRIPQFLKNKNEK